MLARFLPRCSTTPSVLKAVRGSGSGGNSGGWWCRSPGPAGSALCGSQHFLFVHFRSSKPSQKPMMALLIASPPQGLQGAFVRVIVVLEHRQPGFRQTQTPRGRSSARAHHSPELQLNPDHLWHTHHCSSCSASVEHCSAKNTAEGAGGGLLKRRRRRDMK